MSHTELVLVVMPPNVPYYDEVLADPIGFVEQRQVALARVVGEQLHAGRKLPIRKGAEWRVLLPGEDLAGDVEHIRTQYGEEVAAMIASALLDNEGAAVLWQAVEVVPKGHDGAALRVRWAGSDGVAS